MTTHPSGDRAETRLLASLQKQLAVAEAEANLHLSEVQRLRFIVDKITEAAEGGIFYLQDVSTNYMYISEQLANVLGYGDVGLPYSYRHFLEQVHPDDLREATELARLRQNPASTHTAPAPPQNALDEIGREIRADRGKQWWPGRRCCRR